MPVTPSLKHWDYNPYSAKTPLDSRFSEWRHQYLVYVTSLGSTFWAEFSSHLYQFYVGVIPLDLILHCLVFAIQLLMDLCAVQPLNRGHRAALPGQLAIPLLCGIPIWLIAGYTGSTLSFSWSHWNRGNAWGKGSNLNQGSPLMILDSMMASLERSASIVSTSPEATLLYSRVPSGLRWP